VDTFTAYIDTIFRGHAESAEVREAKAKLRAMMEQRREELVAQGMSPDEAAGKVIAEFGSLEQLAPTLGLGNTLASESGHPQTGATGAPLGRIASYYWPCAGAVFLAWGLITNNWASSWIILAVAGAGFAAISAGARRNNGS